MKTKSCSRNACKVCAPLGASLAYAGVQGAVTLLHGSQGCSTYIRRYMISHFREPMDIASSNFGEAAVIFGGGDNFEAALLNIIRQYEPALVGVATTCLAETIGDDVRLFIHAFQEKHRHEALPVIVPVSTPSYKGTQAEGFFRTVRALVETLAQPTDRAAHVNVIPGMVSPADLRFLKQVFADFHADLTLLPDYADTLDGPSWSEFHRLAPGGTAVQAVQSMPGACATVEFGSTLDFSATAGAVLAQRFGVTHHPMALPIGLRNTDLFFQALERITQRSVPDTYLAERGRLQDAYIDAHKYAYGKKAVLYGEEDLVVAMATFLAEFGIAPVLCATGAKSGAFEAALAQALPQWRDRIQCLAGQDFTDIEERARELAPDLIIGNSKGLGLARRLDVPLVRIGFPIHDRVGGARVRHLGYGGLPAALRSNRQCIDTGQTGSLACGIHIHVKSRKEIHMGLDPSKHPCFNRDVCEQVGRIHLPIAPKCNVKCNFCDRKYDCVNESRPGISSTLLAPSQALDYLRQMVDQDPRITVVGIAGPGDAFANGPETLETLRLVRTHFPDLLLCIATNGLNIAPYIDDLAELNVTHVSVTVNAVDPAIGARVYGWVRHNKRVYRGLEAGRIMLDRQLEAIAKLHARGMLVKINTIVISGVNEHHVTEISKVVSEQGADMQNCIPLCPVAGTPFANCGEPDAGLMDADSPRGPAGSHADASLYPLPRRRGGPAQ
jgi:nitrogenase molybdenum-iron protein alpha/beta subunit/pyruvate-formate lyase-activating enzyme